MIVHRLLDAFFKTLDVVDAARDRVDQALGREPRPDPWAVEWPQPVEPPPPAKEGDASASKAPKSPADGPAKTPGEKKAPAKKTAAKKTAAKKTAAKKTGTKKKAATAKPKPKKAAKSSPKRKGSVDRQGKDFESPRARAVDEYLRENDRPVAAEDAEHDGKKVLGRVLWALFAASDAGSEKGLTTADVSALLHLAADMEVFSTNVGRACRDHKVLIEETEPDGRSKRYRLTDAGKKAAAQIATRAR